MKIPIITIFCGMAMMSCRTADSQYNLNGLDSYYQCETGEEAWFLFSGANSEKPERKDIPLIKGFASEKEEKAFFKNIVALRSGGQWVLGTCASDDNNIVLKYADFGDGQGFRPLPSNAIVGGLSKALFDQDASELKVLAKAEYLGAGANSYIGYIGTSKDGGVLKASASIIKNEIFINPEDTYQFSYSGKFEYLEPGKKGSTLTECGRSGIKEGQFKVGTLTLDLKYEVINHSNLNGPVYAELADMCEVTVSDASPHAKFSQPVTYKRSDKNLTWEYPLTHHGWSDKLYFKIPGAGYGLLITERYENLHSNEKANFSPLGFKATYEDGSVQELEFKAPQM